MGVIRKALVTGGLVILTGPLCFMAAAQDYVDVEAERAARAAGGTVSTTAAATTAPYNTPSQTKSYGTNSAPPAPAYRTAAPATAGQAQNMGTLVLQIQQLRQDVMRLNGMVEEQAYELRKLKEQSLERYVDIDKRLSALSAGGAVAPTGGQPGSGGAKVSPAPAAAAGGSTVEQPGEGEAYRAAYALVRGQEFDQAVKAFEQFLRDYPDGKYAPNAHYWLGELFLAVDPQDLESSRQSFMLLVTQYPDHPKVPDALYKLGKVHFLKGNREKAREYLEGVTKAYPDSSAASLSRDFLAENF